MTNHTNQEKIKNLQASTTEEAADSLQNASTYYSFDNGDSGSKRQERGDDTIELDLRAKQIKLGHTEGEMISRKTTSSPESVPATPSTPAPESKSLTVIPDASGKPEEPDWAANPQAWAFLQPLNPKYPSKYLEKRKPDKDGRSGYLLGRKPDCDIVFDQNEISKMHCLIYMETGSNGKAKGIRIFLRDQSFNGTWVNGVKLGRDKRVMLKNNDEIQLFRRSGYASDDPRHKFYRVLFPPVFEANTCEYEYKLNRVLGRGNFASVFYAVHRQTGEEVAIKVLNKARFERKPKMVQSIIQEICIMMTLKRHPLVTKIDRVFNEQQKIYLVLEYVPGGELFEYVSTNKFLDEDTTRFIFWQLFTAIKYLHDNNIVHRDLKPENVLLANKEKLHVKITDFGLAKNERRDQSFGSQCGTPNYVAPEILDSSESRAYSKQCDLWSLGVMLYICLCGFPPFSEENAPPSMKAQIKMGRYEFTAPYWDAISEEAKALVRGLLTVDPLERLTAEEALLSDWMAMNPEELERMKDGLGEEANRAIVDLGATEQLSVTQALMTQSQPQTY